MKPTYPQRVAIAQNMASHRRNRSPHAFSVLTFTGQPTNGQTVTIADRVYVISTGVNLAATIASLAAAIKADPMGRVTAEHDATTVTVEAKRGGWGGAAIATATNASHASWTGASLTYEAAQ
jgi:phage tail sheath gpL-like